LLSNQGRGKWTFYVAVIIDERKLLKKSFAATQKSFSRRRNTMAEQVIIYGKAG